MQRVSLTAHVLVAMAAAMMFGCSHNKETVGVSNATEHPTPVNERVAKEARINSEEASRLNLAWRVQTPGNVSHMPLLWKGKVYFADWEGNVTCADAETGRVTWQKHLETPQKMWPCHGFVGTGAIGRGMLFEASVEGDAFALDPYSGDTIWHQKLTDDPNSGSTATPLFINDRVYFGLSSVDQWMDRMHEGLSRDYKPTSRGGVVCLDAKTGNPVWKKFLVEKPDNGAPIRGGFAYDGQSNTLYFTTGNNYTGEPTELAVSIVAMNADNGEIQWHFRPTRDQTTRDQTGEARNVRDDTRDRTATRTETRPYDFVAAPNIFEAGGRKLVGAGSLDGRYYAVDRDNGQGVWSRQVGDDGPSGGIRDCASFRDGRIYVWSNNNFDDTKSTDPANRPLTVACLDAASGNVVWQKPNSQPAGGWSDGILVNDLYFVGSLDGTIQSYRASDGQVTWNGRIPGGSVASPINAAGNAIFVGAGLPKIFDGMNDAKGVYCFSTARRNAEPASAEMRRSE